MKAIINGVRYDTTKATLVGEADHGNYPADGNFSAWSAALYVSPRSKRFFLAGKGGGMTMFATLHSDRSRSGGSRLIPMTTADALEWAEEHLDAETIEQYFVIEDA